MSARKPTVSIGDKFGYLTVISSLDKRSRSGNRIYYLKCDCGSFCEKPTDKLRKRIIPQSIALKIVL